MNILPKKSWHVRSRKNIERVKQDEAKAAEEKKKAQERAALADQEARTALLRKRAGQLTAPGDNGDRGKLTADSDREPDVHRDDDKSAVRPAGDAGATFGHVDLFSHLSAEKPKGEKNKEHEQEEKAAREKYERSIGLLTYLGQSSVEAQTAKPWYFRPSGRATSEEAVESGVDTKRKAVQDPMLEMEKYLGTKRAREGSPVLPLATLLGKSRLQPSVPRPVIPANRPAAATAAAATAATASAAAATARNRLGRLVASPDEGLSSGHKHRAKEKERKKKKKKKEEKKRSKHRRHSDDDEDSRRTKVKRKKSKHRHGDGNEDKPSRERTTLDRKEKKRGRDEDGRETGPAAQGPSVAQLRAQRLQREAGERAKSNRLLAQRRGEVGPAEAEAEAKAQAEADRPGRYNSQFHPELARNKHKSFQPTGYL